VVNPDRIGIAFLELEKIISFSDGHYLAAQEQTTYLGIFQEFISAAGHGEVA